ncbi:hypothetical protein CONPUDRAFT_80209, partial [Coniophora puteana RWD-64-598 SS2]
MALKLDLSSLDPLKTTLTSPDGTARFTTETDAGPEKKTRVTLIKKVGTESMTDWSTEIGRVEWQEDQDIMPAVMLGDRVLDMTKTGGKFTSPEKFQASDGEWYEWRIQSMQPTLVPLSTGVGHVATFSSSTHRSGLKKVHTASLFIAPEGMHLLDEIVITFVYFLARWRNREAARERKNGINPLAWIGIGSSGGAI